MKVDYLTVKKRRDDIMRIIQKMGKVDMTTLENEFKVSPVTLRRDLQYWEDKGAIIRYHGGAKLVQNMIHFDNNEFTNERYKHGIAKYAARLVEENDTIFINTSSTALLIIQYIIGKRCTIITNNAKAIFIKHDPLVQIALTGGELRFPKESLVGDIALNALNKVVATKCFLGCGGLNAENGMTTAIMPEVIINETMLQRTAGQKFIVCDYTKIGLTHSFITAPIEKIDHIITDISASDLELDEIRQRKPDIIIEKVPPLHTLPSNDEFNY